MSEPVSNRGWIGRTLEGRYEILDVIGEGGMGAVFKARHLLLDKEVALKVVHPGLSGNEELAARFAREATLTSRLDHPNVISVSDSGTLEDGSAYLAMQFVRGPSLTHVLETEGPMHWSRVLAVGAQLADALTAARAHGIVHRDLKPDNILLQALEDGTELVKVLDFGIARFTSESMAPPSMRGAKHNLTQTGLVVGTPGYMSPEQSMGEPADYRSDLYALGVILWECLTGQRLWEGDDIPSIVERQLTTPPPSPRAISGDQTIPDELDALVLTLLSRKAAQRPHEPSTVKEVLATLGSDLSSSSAMRVRTGTQPTLPVRNERVSVAEMPTVFDQDASAAQPAASGPRRTLRPRNRTLGLIGLLAVLLVGAAGALVWSGTLEVRTGEHFDRVAGKLGADMPDRIKKAVADVVPGHDDVDGDLGVPDELQPQFMALMGADTRGDRVGAARALLAHIPMEEIEPYIRAVAHLQLAETCVAKRESLESVTKVGDPRALPALHQLAARPRRGCGKKNRRDCLGCMRRELRSAIGDLEAKQLAL